MKQYQEALVPEPESSGTELGDATAVDTVDTEGLLADLQKLVHLLVIL